MRMSRSRSLAPLLAVLAAVAVTALGLVPPASAAAAPFCGLTWGSAPRTSDGAAPVRGALLTDVRAGRQGCFDRLVLDLRGTTSLRSWRVEYVPRVSTDPGGQAVPLRGGAFLQVTLGASDHTANGVPTYRPADRRELVDVTGFRTFRQVAWAGSFEGVTSVGLGVRARLPFRVFALSGIPGDAGGTRVVVDVAHRWVQ